MSDQAAVNLMPLIAPAEREAMLGNLRRLKIYVRATLAAHNEANRNILRGGDDPGIEPISAHDRLYVIYDRSSNPTELRLELIDEIAGTACAARCALAPGVSRRTQPMTPGSMPGIALVEYEVFDADTSRVVYSHDDEYEACLDAAHRNALADIRGAERDRFLVRPSHLDHRAILRGGRH